MNHRNYLILLVFTALCSAIFACCADTGNFLLTILSFPFSQIGSGLRWLSLHSSVGNIAAWIIYLLVCGLPLVGYVWLFHNKRNQSVDLLLPVTAVTLAIALYKSINPYGTIFSATESGLQMLISQYGAAVYITVLGWFLLHIVQNFFSAKEPTLYHLLSVFLKLFGICFVISAFGGCFEELLSSINSIRSNNQNSGSLILTYLMASLHYIAEVLPDLLNTVTVFLSLDFLKAFTENSESTVLRAEQLAKWCGISLCCTIISGIVFHALQLLVINHLRIMNTTIVFPLYSIAFLIVCLLAARIVAENKRLRDDNELFI